LQRASTQLTASSLSSAARPVTSRVVSPQSSVTVAQHRQLVTAPLVWNAPTATAGVVLHVSYSVVKWLLSDLAIHSHLSYIHLNATKCHCLSHVSSRTTHSQGVDFCKLLYYFLLFLMMTVVFSHL